MASIAPSGETVAEATSDMIFALGRLLHQAGHRELAAVLGGAFDAFELRHPGGREASFLTPLARQDDAVLNYVIDQLAQMAELLEQRGETDRAALLRLPALLGAYTREREAGTARPAGLFEATGRC